MQGFPTGTLPLIVDEEADVGSQIDFPASSLWNPLSRNDKCRSPAMWTADGPQSALGRWLWRASTISATQRTARRKGRQWMTRCSSIAPQPAAGTLTGASCLSLPTHCCAVPFMRR